MKYKNLILLTAFIVGCLAAVTLNSVQAQTSLLSTPLDVDGNITTLDKVLGESSERIINGRPVLARAEAPHSVQVGLASDYTVEGVGTWVKGSSFCGASKIASRIFALAAHCIDPANPPYQGLDRHTFAVYGGLSLLAGSVMPRIDANISCVMHPDYNKTEYGNTFYYARDLALCLADRDTPNIAVIPVARSMPVAGTLLNIVGYGNTVKYADRLAGASKAFSTDLMSVDLPLIEDSEAQRLVFPYQYYAKLMFVAGYPKANFERDSSFGDSGNGVTANGLLYGVVSHGFPEVGVGVYTKLSAIDWSRFPVNYVPSYLLQSSQPRSDLDQAGFVDTSLDCSGCNFPQRSTLGNAITENPYYDFIANELGELIPVEPYEWEPQNEKLKEMLAARQMVIEVPDTPVVVAEGEALELSRGVNSPVANQVGLDPITGEPCECLQFPQSSISRSVERPGEAKLEPDLPAPIGISILGVGQELPENLQHPSVDLLGTGVRSLNNDVCAGVPFEATAYGEITRYVDGDTVAAKARLSFLNSVYESKIRLVYIDTPELRGNTKEKAKESTEELRRLTEGKRVAFSFAGKGNFGRSLACIFTDDSDLSANQRLLNSKHAVLYRRK